MTGELYVGLMAGTSMDGIDAALVEFGPRGAHLRATHSEPLAPALRASLLAVNAGTSISHMLELDAKLGDAFARTTRTLIARAGVSTADIAAIGSHGQTLWHAPEGPLANTLQVGDPWRIVQQTGVTVVADFRRGDMAAGGQGAPLGPAFHQALFDSPDEERVVVNIGGMANLTYLPVRGSSAPVTGFDTGPGNTLMDAWHARHRGGAFDADGQWAASGQVDTALLKLLLADPWFHRAPPKSTGKEYFTEHWLADKGVANHQPACVQATLAELTAISISDAIRAWAPGGQRVLICGGGALNGHLMRRLAWHMPESQVASTASERVAPEWVEAVGFAWLARERLAGRPGNLPAVTGANAAVLLGAVYCA